MVAIAFLLINTVNILVRICDLVFFPKPESVESTVQYIFFGFLKPNEYVETRLQSLIIFLLLGIVWWAIQKYYFKRFD